MKTTTLTPNDLTATLVQFNSTTYSNNNDLLVENGNEIFELELRTDSQDNNYLVTKSHEDTVYEINADEYNFIIELVKEKGLEDSEAIILKIIEDGLYQNRSIQGYDNESLKTNVENGTIDFSITKKQGLDTFQFEFTNVKVEKEFFSSLLTQKDFCPGVTSSISNYLIGPVFSDNFENGFDSVRDEELPFNCKLSKNEGFEIMEVL